MHTHRCYNAGILLETTMRTTIEISEENHTLLRTLAIQRKEKGFSKIIDEALHAYFQNQSTEQNLSLLEFKGKLTKNRMNEYVKDVKSLRNNWRNS